MALITLPNGMQYDTEISKNEQSTDVQVEIMRLQDNCSISTTYNQIDGEDVIPLPALRTWSAEGVLMTETYTYDSNWNYTNIQFTVEEAI